MRVFCGYVLPVCVAPVLADFLGRSYLEPTDLSSNQSLVAPAWESLSSSLRGLVGGGNQSSLVPGIENVTFSLGMFSLYDDKASDLQFHYTSPEIANAPSGTHSVDADSIYRVASVTKVFTVLSGLLQLSSTDWERPLPELIPTLADFTSQVSAEDDPVNMVDWNKITPSALAAQIAGVPRDAFPAPGELVFRLAPELGTGVFDALVELGFPPIADNDPVAYQPCYGSLLNGTLCPEEPYLEGVGASAPTFLPWTTPGYSDAGFALLGLAIASVSGKPMEEIYQSAIFGPLGMTSSNSSTPPQYQWDRCVIPGDAAVNFVYGADFAVSSGGLLSTLNDLARFGRGVLNSSLLAPEETRRWLKPFSHTAHLEYSVGRPWEIMRFSHPTTGAVTDLYTKLGDSGAYSAFLVLLPDYGAGFNILASGTATERSAVVLEIADLVADTIIPALEAQAAAESECNLGGVYTSDSGAVNSSITLALNHTEGAAPGLHIISWVSNGTDVLHGALADYLGTQPYRLVPSIDDHEGGKTAFWMVDADDEPNAQVAPGSLVSAPGFSQADWISVGSALYGGRAVKRFVFDLAEDGQAETISPTAFKITLSKE